MKTLTKIDAVSILGAGDYNYNEAIYIYIPTASFEQPIVMYTSKRNKETMHYLGNDLKDRFAAGMYSYNIAKEG